MSFPLNFGYDGNPIVRTEWNGVVWGWKSAEDRRRFEGYINKNFARVLGKVYDPAKPVLDFTPMKFTTKAAFDEFTASHQPATVAQLNAVFAALKEAGADIDAIRLDLADEEGEPLEETAPVDPPVPPPAPGG